MYSGIVLRSVWILVVSHLQTGRSEEMGTVAGEPAVLNHMYEPSGPLVSIAFYEILPTGLEAIVLYFSSSNSTTYPNNHDPSKWELVRETDSASMIIHNTVDDDLATYHSIIVHGNSETKDHNFTFLVPDTVVQSFMIEGCDANQLFNVSTEPHKISTSCKELTVTSDQYDHPYDVYYGSPPDVPDIFTCQTSSCDTKIPLDSFKVGDNIEIVIDLKLISDPPTNRTFQFIYIDGGGREGGGGGLPWWLILIIVLVAVGVIAAAIAVPMCVTRKRKKSHLEPSAQPNERRGDGRGPNEGT